MSCARRGVRGPFDRRFDWSSVEFPRGERQWDRMNKNAFTCFIIEESILDSSTSLPSQGPAKTSAGRRGRRAPGLGLASKPFDLDRFPERRGHAGRVEMSEPGACLEILAQRLMGHRQECPILRRARAVTQSNLNWVGPRRSRSPRPLGQAKTSAQNSPPQPLPRKGGRIHNLRDESRVRLIQRYWP